MEDDDLEAAEREERRHELRRRELARDREAQARAAALTKELTAQYGLLKRSGG